MEAPPIGFQTDCRFLGKQTDCRFVNPARGAQRAGYPEGECAVVQQRGRATREQLVAIARRLFAERGYEGASVEAVLSESGVSRGALYHHFESKEALFEAALEAVERDIAIETAAAARGVHDP